MVWGARWSCSLDGERGHTRKVHGTERERRATKLGDLKQGIVAFATVLRPLNPTNGDLVSAVAETTGAATKQDAPGDMTPRQGLSPRPITKAPRLEPTRTDAAAVDDAKG